jgi:hypothetical protein
MSLYTVRNQSQHMRAWTDGKKYSTLELRAPYGVASLEPNEEYRRLQWHMMDVKSLELSLLAMSSCALLRSVTKLLPPLHQLTVLGARNCMAVLRALKTNTHSMDVMTPQLRDLDLLDLYQWLHPVAGDRREVILRDIITQMLESRESHGHHVAVLHLPGDICTGDWIARLCQAQLQWWTRFFISEHDYPGYFRQTCSDNLYTMYIGRPLYSSLTSHPIFYALVFTTFAMNAALSYKSMHEQPQQGRCDR